MQPRSGLHKVFCNYYKNADVHCYIVHTKILRLLCRVHLLCGNNAGKEENENWSRQGWENAFSHVYRNYSSKKSISTYFIKYNDLLQQLKKAKSENCLNDRKLRDGFNLKHFCKYRLLIIDELGYLHINKEDSNLFFR